VHAHGASKIALS